MYHILKPLLVDVLLVTCLKLKSYTAPAFSSLRQILTAESKYTKQPPEQSNWHVFFMFLSAQKFTDSKVN